jgi:hypothetical protein
METFSAEIAARSRRLERFGTYRPFLDSEAIIESADDLTNTRLTSPGKELTYTTQMIQRLPTATVMKKHSSGLDALRAVAILFSGGHKGSNPAPRIWSTRLRLDGGVDAGTISPLPILFDSPPLWRGGDRDGVEFRDRFLYSN